MGMFEDVLAWMDNKRRVAGRNVSDLWNDPSNALSKTGYQAALELKDPNNYGPGAMKGMFGATAWHGSPHKFDKFSLDKIGTGEGAQAYGHGLYLAESPEVAKDYMRLGHLRLGNPTVAGEDIFSAANRLGIEGKSGTSDTLRDFRSFISTADNADAVVSRKIGKNELLQQFKDRTLSEADQAGDKYADFYKARLSDIGFLEKNLDELPASSLYKTDIPDEAVARFLDWDKPLSQQHPDVREALKRRITDVKPVDGFDMGGNAKLRDNRDGVFAPDNYHPWILEATGGNGTSKFGLTQKDVDRMFGTKDVSELTGEQIISRLAAERGGQSAASEYLKSINVPGIRYLDGGSRSAGKGSSNFVVFDPEMIRILERNGQSTGKMPWKRGEFDLKDTTYEPPLFPDTTR